MSIPGSMPKGLCFEQQLAEALEAHGWILVQDRVLDRWQKVDALVTGRGTLTFEMPVALQVTLRIGDRDKMEAFFGRERLMNRVAAPVYVEVSEAAPISDVVRNLERIFEDAQMRGGCRRVYRVESTGKLAIMHWKKYSDASPMPAAPLQSQPVAAPIVQTDAAVLALAAYRERCRAKDSEDRLPMRELILDECFLLNVGSLKDTARIALAAKYYDEANLRWVERWALGAALPAGSGGAQVHRVASRRALSRAAARFVEHFPGANRDGAHFGALDLANVLIAAYVSKVDREIMFDFFRDWIIPVTTLKQLTLQELALEVYGAELNTVVREQQNGHVVVIYAGSEPAGRFRHSNRRMAIANAEQKALTNLRARYVARM